MNINITCYKTLDRNSGGFDNRISLESSFINIKNFESNDKFCLIDGKKYFFCLEWFQQKIDIKILIYYKNLKLRYNGFLEKNRYISYREK